MSPAALSRHLAAIESLTDDVQRASKHLEQAQLKKVSADQSASKARGIHAMHAHQKRKWVRLAAMIATSRRARGEFLAEIDVEEEGSLGWRRCHLLRGKVR
ncbi:MAG: hypothetical protein J2P50_05505 [Hyphomicrobiaceae bacterium]|nr:hypothetical protein [Hyphomicrobiaceae bacterium]